MDLSINGVVPVKNNALLRNTQVSKKETAGLNQKELNLDLDPKAVSFKGLFTNLFRTKKKEEQIVQEAGIYGPYKVTPTAARLNDEDAEMVVGIIADYMKVKNYAPTNHDEYVKNRASKALIKELKKPFFSLVCYYEKSPTSFPRFYDSVARALPAACAKIDEMNKNDNTTRLYEEIVKDINKFGAEFEPNTLDKFESGIKYLYRTNEFPSFALADDEDSTEETLEHFRQGRMPEFDYHEIVSPRNHLSKVINEDVYYKGTRYEKFSTDKSDWSKADFKAGNKNYKQRPPEPVYREVDELEPWDDIWKY